MISELLEMQLNDGRFSDLKMFDTVKTKNPKNLDMLAEGFSERSIALKNLLLSLWSRGIDTIACCGGHSNPKEAHSQATKNCVPYVTIIARNMLSQDLITLIKQIKEEYVDDVEINCRNNINNKNELLLSFEFKGAVKDWRKIDDTREAFFKMLQDKMASIKTLKKNSDCEYKIEIVKGLMNNKSHIINLMWESKSQGTVYFIADSQDENGHIFVTLPIDALEKLLPYATKYIADLKNGEGSSVRFEFPLEEELNCNL